MTLALNGRITALLGLLTTSGAFASEPLQVTLTADEFDGVCDTHCSLRDAITAANLAEGPQQIRLLPGNYVLSLPSLPDANGFAGNEDGNLDGDFDVRGQLTIQGSGATRTRIIGQVESRLFEVMSGAQLSLLRLSLENGRSGRNGGALANHGELLLREVLLDDNQASTPHAIGNPPPLAEAFDWGQGGALANYGSAQIYASTFQLNKAQGLYYGNNLGRGGAIFNSGTLLVRDSHFDRNSVEDQGDRGHGGALYNLGVADVARSLFTANQYAENGGGGAIFNTAAGVLKLSNSTLSHNWGAIYNGYVESPSEPVPSATLINVSIAQSSGPGLVNRGDVLIRNSLMVNNYDPYDIDQPFDCSTSGPTSHYRAIGLLTSSPTSTCTADYHEAAERVFSHLLEPLADNGGLTQTLALRPGSMALDAGLGSCSGHDQRRLPRPLDGNGDGVAVCDLGAYERAAP
ncbi:MAG TPA: CSLREA domain-containing protein [Pseudomonas sp.]|nr:CSLREA domain-containing protein [Pseudomonas sp.]